MQLSYAKQLLHTITKALARGRNGRAVRRQEKKMQSNIDRAFKKQGEYFAKEYAKLDKKWGTKALEDDVDKIFDNLDNEDLISGISAVAATSLNLGGKTSVQKNKLGKIGISFTMSNPLAEQYMTTDRPFIWSKLPDTTKMHIKPLLLESIQLGRAPKETGKLIAENYGLSKTRSLMISVNEVGSAYVYGNYVPMKDAKDKGFDVKKSWITVNDDKVTPSHTQNQDDGWIELEETFSGTGDELAPASDNPNCRCDILYDII